MEMVKIAPNVFMAKDFWKTVIEHAFDALKDCDFPNVHMCKFEEENKNEKL